MASEKKQRFLSKIFTVKHAGCCDMKIEEIRDASADNQEKRGPVQENMEEKMSQPNPAVTARRPARPCCGESTDAKSGGCCG